MNDLTLAKRKASVQDRRRNVEDRAKLGLLTEGQCRKAQRYLDEVDHRRVQLNQADGVYREEER
jgi:hypothetical protein